MPLRPDVWSVMMAGTFVPVAEEVVFQGWLQGRLNRWNGWVGLFGTAAVAHAGFTLAMLPPLYGFLVFGALRWRTGALAAPILAHAVINACLVGFVFFQRF